MHALTHAPALALLLVAGCATPHTFLDRISRDLPAAGAAPESDDFKSQLQGMALSMVGREDRIVWPQKNSECRPLVRDGAEVEPLAEIVRRAASAQVVIINEAHHEPQGRAFIKDVVGALRPLGFAIYAAETFRPTVGRNLPRYPLVTDGYYTNEPTFGDVVRLARSVGYALVPYEMEAPRHKPAPSNDPTASMNEREEAEAENLVRRIFSADPHARVLIHVGYSHARKLEDDGVKWMAMRLAQKTGIAPLTIDQTSFGPSGDRWRLCAADADGKPLDATFDLRVAPPAVRFDRGRPLWRRARGQQAVQVPPSLVPKNERAILEARRAGEPDDAVPVDRLLIDPGEDLPLLLPVGSYRVRAVTPRGQPSSAVPITVR